MELAWKSFKKFYFFKKNLINKMLVYGEIGFLRENVKSADAYFQFASVYFS